MGADFVQRIVDPYVSINRISSLCATLSGHQKFGQLVVLFEGKRKETGPKDRGPERDTIVILEKLQKLVT
jgi:hypothetical protein